MADERLVARILSGQAMDLEGSDLTNANLMRANLRNANLSGANLRNASLIGADLSHANLTDANLDLANLRDVELVRAELGNANLIAADLSCANLKCAGLDRANLRAAKCWLANLSDADLSETDLRGAVLRDVTLRSANLWEADLRRAKLSFADLSGAELHGANLKEAVVDGTNFVDLDLRKTIGLEEMIHEGPSALDVHTIIRSKGEIPEIFLRGCGLPDAFIEYQRSLIASPIEFYSCFISYSHENKSFARRLHDQLQARGIRCWLDEHQIKPGDNIYTAIDRGLRLWDKTLLCCSKESLTGWWVDNEVTTALEKEQALLKERGQETLALIPLNLDGYLFSEECEYPKRAQLRQRYAPDFSGWESDNAKFESAFEEVVGALRSDDAAREAPPEPKL